jgi:hypothetical protein
MTNILQLKNLPEPWKDIATFDAAFLSEENRNTGI